MRSGVIAQKVGMTRIFTEAGEHVPGGRSGMAERRSSSRTVWEEQPTWRAMASADRPRWT